MGDREGTYRDFDRPPGAGKALAALAARQYRVVSLAQLRGLGFDRDRVRVRVANGVLHPVHRGVYAVGIPQLSPRGRYLAAVIASGPHAALSHRSAAHLWGLRPNAAGYLEVTVPRKRAGIPDVRAYRSRMMDAQDFTVEDGIPVTSVARTLLDLGAVVAANDLAVAIDRAERLRIFDLTAVGEVLERARGKRGARALRRAIAAYAPSTQRSELEKRFRRLVDETADIPSPAFNAITQGETRTHEVDALWEQPRLAVQLDGFAFHHTRRDMERDAAADADLELVGFQVLRLTWDDVTVRSDRTLRRLRMRLAGGEWAR